MLRRPRSLWDGLVFGAPLDGGQIVDLTAPSATPSKGGAGSVTSVDGVNGRAATSFPGNVKYEWAYRPSFGTMGGAATLSILIRPTTDTPGVNQYCFWIGSTTYVGLRRSTTGTWIWQVGSTNITPAPTAVIGDWIHTALIVNGGDACAIYRNLNTGVMDMRISSPSPPLGVLSGAAVSIGALAGSVTGPMYANVQNACMWNRALNMDELTRAATWDFRS